MQFLLPCPDHPEGSVDLVHFEYELNIMDIGNLAGWSHVLILIETCRTCGKTLEFRIPMTVIER